MSDSEASASGSNRESNWLVSFLVVIFVPLAAFTPYLMMAGAYKSPNPESWIRSDSSATLLTAFTLTIFSLAYYYVREKDLNTNQYIELLIDLKEYQGKKYIDYLLSHYGNVSSVAVITALIVLAYREAINIVGISISSLGVSIALIVIFTTYGLVFLKAAFGAINRGRLASLSLPALLCIDVMVIPTSPPI